MKTLQKMAFPLVVVLGLHRRAYGILEPLLEFIRHIPPLALIPILILWFGIGEVSKLAVIFLATFFPVFLNTLGGVANCDSRLLEVGKVFSFTPGEQFFRIILPQAIPQVLVGMQLGLGYSWRSLIGAELIAASSLLPALRKQCRRLCVSNAAGFDPVNAAGYQLCRL